MKNPFIPKIAKHDSRREQFMFFVVCLCGLFDDLISIFSFGFLHTEARAYALFELFAHD